MTNTYSLLHTSYTVISTGMMVPALSCVAALYSLQNCIMLTPLAPRAGPTGGAGLALPAANASLIMPVTVRVKRMWRPRQMWARRQSSLYLHHGGHQMAHETHPFVRRW